MTFEVTAWGAVVLPPLHKTCTLGEARLLLSCVVQVLCPA